MLIIYPRLGFIRPLKAKITMELIEKRLSKTTGDGFGKEFGWTVGKAN
jgi:hypothetical protein